MTSSTTFEQDFLRDWSYKYPSYWNYALTDKNSAAVPLDNSFGQSLAGFFVHSVFSGPYRITSSSYKLLGVDVVANRMRYDMYQLNKSEMQSRLTNVREKLLWHGMAPSKLDAILQNGFLRDYGTRQQYGDGSYFATFASYSFHDGFSIPEVNPTTGKMNKVILLSRVLVGDYCQGHSGMKVPSTKPDGRLYDSMTDSQSNPTMFVLSAGSDHRAYPEFVFRFEYAWMYVKKQSKVRKSDIKQMLRVNIT